MKEEIYITRGLSISKKFFTLLWMFFCLISIAVGIKMQNLVISMAIIVGIPVLFYLMKVPKKLIYAEIIYVLLIRVFITIFKIVPQSAMYVTDIFNLIAFIIALSKYLTNRKSKINVKLPVIIVISMLLFSIIGLIINGQSILLFMWGIRNTYRFFAFIFSCIVLLEKEDVNKLLKILNKVFILNLISFFLASFLVIIFTPRLYRWHIWY